MIVREEGPEVPTRVPKNLLIIKIKAASMRIHEKSNGRTTIEDSSACHACKDCESIRSCPTILPRPSFSLTTAMQWPDERMESFLLWLNCLTVARSMR